MLLKKPGPRLIFALIAFALAYVLLFNSFRIFSGFASIGLIIFICSFKYPAFKFASIYTSINKKSITYAYGQMPWVLLLFLFLIFLPSFAIVTSVFAFTSAGLFLSVFSIPYHAKYVAIILMITNLIILFLGGYNILQKLSKIFLAILILGGLVTTFAFLPFLSLFLFPMEFLLYFSKDSFLVFFILMVFIPAPFDVSIINSIWVTIKSNSKKINLKNMTFDFDFGLILTLLLTLCFAFIGIILMQGKGTSPIKEIVFSSNHIINHFRSSVGDIIGTIIGFSAFMLFYIITFILLNSFAHIVQSFFVGIKNKFSNKKIDVFYNNYFYLFFVIIFILASLLMLIYENSFQSLIIFATITAFLYGSFIALLNHLAINTKEIRKTYKPHWALNLWSLIVIIISLLITFSFLVLNFGLTIMNVFYD